MNSRRWCKLSSLLLVGSSKSPQLKTLLLLFASSFILVLACTQSSEQTPQATPAQQSTAQSTVIDQPVVQVTNEPLETTDTPATSGTDDRAAGAGCSAGTLVHSQARPAQDLQPKLTVITATGMPAAGGSTKFEGFASSASVGDGFVVLSATTDDAKTGVWRFNLRTKTLSPLAIADQPSPGFAGALFSGTRYALANESGEALFHSGLYAPDRDDFPSVMLEDCGEQPATRATWAPSSYQGNLRRVFPQERNYRYFGLYRHSHSTVVELPRSSLRSWGHQKIVPLGSGWQLAVRWNFSCSRAIRSRESQELGS
jgi:hypothetical protein